MKNLICLISTSFVLAACQSTPTIRMLDKKADYESATDVSFSLSDDYQGGRTKNPTTATIFIHAHETASDAYFHGGFMTIKMADESQWFTEAAGSFEAPLPSGVLK